MRQSITGFGAALLAAGLLAGCGNEPQPLGPAGSNYESAREPDEDDAGPPIAPAPETLSDPFTEPGLPGSAPGEIPEVMEDPPLTSEGPGAETTMDELYPEMPLDKPDETGAPL